MIILRHQIIHLRFRDHDGSSILVMRAEFDNDMKYLPGHAMARGFCLEGSYLTIDSTDGILVWNWEDDTMCTIRDPGGNQWVRGFGS